MPTNFLDCRFVVDCGQASSFFEVNHSGRRGLCVARLNTVR
jgi:hypothetical protein